MVSRDTEFTFSHLADAFIQSDLELGDTKRLILKRQTDRGSAHNTKSQALFNKYKLAREGEKERYTKKGKKMFYDEVK